MTEYKSDKRLYLDADGNVTEDETQGVTLLVGAGGVVPSEVAKQHGLKEQPKAEDKAAAKSENKAQKQPDTKDAG